MSIQFSNAAFIGRKSPHFKSSCFSPVSASLDYGLERVAAAKSCSLCFEETRERISKLIQKPDISASNLFGNAVYPFDIHAKLSLIDTLECLGISQHFRKEIQGILDETYRCWMQDEEDIFMDTSTCALAFRLLRMNGYDVSSDQIAKVVEEDYRFSFLAGYKADMYRNLELYKATEIMFPDEVALEKLNLRLKHSLEQQISNDVVYSSEIDRNLCQEVKHALEYPFYSVMERVAKRRYIERYNSNLTRTLKTSTCKSLLYLSVADFNKCQEVHREELKELERWFVESRLNELKFARSKCAYCYFGGVATIFSLEILEARMTGAKNGVLTTVVDDFFDVGGSLEELKNLIHLIEAWDVDISTECSSQNVLVIFSALKSAISDMAGKAYVIQERDVTKHLIDIWLNLLNAMLKETEWARNGYVPTMDEYMSNAHVSMALGPNILPSVYLVGPKLSEEMVNHPEYNDLLRLVGTCGRLLNDIRGYKKDLQHGKISSVPLYMIKAGDDMTEDVAIAELEKLIDSNRRELLRLVLDGKNSVIPRACKDLFWHMSTVVHQFYSKDDGYTLEDLMGAANSIIQEPIILDEMFK